MKGGDPVPPFAVYSRADSVKLVVSIFNLKHHLERVANGLKLTLTLLPNKLNDDSAVISGSSLTGDMASLAAKPIHAARHEKSSTIVSAFSDAFKELPIEATKVRVKIVLPHKITMAPLHVSHTGGDGLHSSPATLLPRPSGTVRFMKQWIDASKRRRGTKRVFGPASSPPDLEWLLRATIQSANSSESSPELGRGTRRSAGDAFPLRRRLPLAWHPYLHNTTSGSRRSRNLLPAARRRRSREQRAPTAKEALRDGSSPPRSTRRRGRLPQRPRTKTAAATAAAAPPRRSTPSTCRRRCPR